MGVANYDVIVVGAGPAGLTAATALARQDLSVLVLEQSSVSRQINSDSTVLRTNTLVESQLITASELPRLNWERRLIERSFYSTNGYSLFGLTYRDSDAFSQSYIFKQSVLDNYLASLARQSGAAILDKTSAIALIKDRHRVVGVQTHRGPLYSKLVYLAENDSSLILAKEGYEFAASGRRGPDFTMVIQQVFHLASGAIEEVFRLEPEQGVANEFWLRPDAASTSLLPINSRGFLITNRNSLTLGVTVPLKTLSESSNIRPQQVLRWFCQTPTVERWVQDARPGHWGAHLCRSGGIRQLPQLVDHGLAAGGNAAGFGSDFPVLNYSEAAIQSSWILAEAVRSILDRNGQFTREQLTHSYLEPLKESVLWKDLEQLRRWQLFGSVQWSGWNRVVRFLHASLLNWTLPEVSTTTRWRRWIRVLRRTLGTRAWFEFGEELRQLRRAFGWHRIIDEKPVWRSLVTGIGNSLRDIAGRRRPNLSSAGSLQFRFEAADDPTSLQQLPKRVVLWSQRFSPVMAVIAREMLSDEPRPLQQRFSRSRRLALDQLNILDFTLAAGAISLLQVGGVLQTLYDWLRFVMRRPRPDDSSHSFWKQWLTNVHRRGASLAVPSEPLPRDDAVTQPYQFKMQWPVSIRNRAAIVDDPLWHTCPSDVFDIYKTSTTSQLDSQIQQIIVDDNRCIGCQACIRVSALVDITPNYTRESHRAQGRDSSTLSSQRQLADLTATHSPRPPLALDWWAPTIARIQQSIGVGVVLNRTPQYFTEIGKWQHVLWLLEMRLGDLHETIRDRVTLIEVARIRWIESLLNQACSMSSELELSIRDSPLAHVPQMTQAINLLSATAASIHTILNRLPHQIMQGEFFWVSADSLYVVNHHVHGMKRILHLFAESDGYNFDGDLLLQPWLFTEANRSDLNERMIVAHECISQSSHNLHSPTLIADYRDAIDGRSGREHNNDDEKPIPARTTLLNGIERHALLRSLGRGRMDAAWHCASHFWAVDALRLADRNSGTNSLDLENLERVQLSLAWRGIAELDEDVDEIRLNGQKFSVASAGVEYFVVFAGDAIAVVGTRNEILSSAQSDGDTGGLVTLRFDQTIVDGGNVSIKSEAFERQLVESVSLDIGSVTLGWLEELNRWATAVSKMADSSGLRDDSFRLNVTVHGITKSARAYLETQIYMLETLLSLCRESSENHKIAMQLSVVLNRLHGTGPRSLAHNVLRPLREFVTESELSTKLHVTTLLGSLTIPEQYCVHRLSSTSQLDELTFRGAIQEVNAVLLDQVRSRKTLDYELRVLENTELMIRDTASFWGLRHTRVPDQGPQFSVVARGLAHRELDLVVAMAMLLRTHARLETGRPGELEVEKLRVVCQEILDAAHQWVDWISDPRCHLPILGDLDDLNLFPTHETRDEQDHWFHDRIEIARAVQLHPRSISELERYHELFEVRLILESTCHVTNTSPAWLKDTAREVTSTWLQRLTYLCDEVCAGDLLFARTAFDDEHSLMHSHTAMHNEMSFWNQLRDLYSACQASGTDKAIGEWPTIPHESILSLHLPGSRQFVRSSERIGGLRTALIDQLETSFTMFGRSFWSNPNLQCVFSDVLHGVVLINTARRITALLVERAEAGEITTGNAGLLALTARALSRISNLCQHLLDRCRDASSGLNQGVYPPGVHLLNLLERSQFDSGDYSKRSQPAHLLKRSIRVAMVFVPRGSVNSLTYPLNEVDLATARMGGRISNDAPVRSTVISFAVGPRRFCDSLRTALALGADKAVLVEQQQFMSDIESVAYELSVCIQRTMDKPDLILIPDPLFDAEELQTAFVERLAAHFDVEIRSGVSQFQIELDQNKSYVLLGGESDAEPVSLPLLLSISGQDRGDFSTDDFLEASTKPVIIVAPDRTSSSPERLEKS